MCYVCLYSPARLCAKTCECNHVWDPESYFPSASAAIKKLNRVVVVVSFYVFARSKRISREFIIYIFSPMLFLLPTRKLDAACDARKMSILCARGEAKKLPWTVSRERRLRLSFAKAFTEELLSQGRGTRVNNSGYDSDCIRIWNMYMSAHIQYAKDANIIQKNI